MIKHLVVLVSLFSLCATAALAGDPVVGTDGIVRYEYGARMAPTLHCAPLIVCDIQLSPDEAIKTPPVAGDTVQWIIRVGSGAQPYIYVKPVSVGLRTNLIVTTTKREYHINLVSNESVSHTSMGFYYPQDPSVSSSKGVDVSSLSDMQQISTAIATNQNPGSDAPSGDNGPVLINPLHLDHGYDVTGNAVFKPLTVFNDGIRTYIQLPPKLTEMPVVIGYDTSGLEVVINYEDYDGYYILNSLYPRVGLVLGTGRDRHYVMINKKGHA